MHAGRASVGGELPDRIAIPFRFGNEFDQLPDDMAQTMDLELTRDMAGNSARILNVLLPMKNLPDRLGLWSGRVPHMNCEDERAAARIVIEDHLGRRVRQDSAVPIELTVNADSRKGWRQRAGCQDMLDPNFHV